MTNIKDRNVLSSIQTIATEFEALEEYCEQLLNENRLLERDNADLTLKNQDLELEIKRLQEALVEMSLTSVKAE